MAKYVRVAFITVLAMMVLLLGSLPATAAKKMKWKVVAHVTDVHLLNVQDAKNHVMGIYEHQGVALFSNGEAASFMDRGSFDMYKPTGTHLGYVKMSFQDGSTIEFKYQGREYRKKGYDLPFVKGNGKFMKGTGRFRGISGPLTYEGGYVTPYDKEKGLVGDSLIEYDASFTLSR